MADKRVSLKLLIDNHQQRVLFAEGEKDFVDFIFTVLTLPLGMVVKLLTTSSMVGCLGKLYESVENLNQNYMQHSQTKDTLLSPKTLHLNHKTPLLRSESDEYSGLKFYQCSNNCWLHVSSSPNAVCPTNKNRMAEVRTYVAPPTGTVIAGSTETGYVKASVTYMIMDDLEVKPDRKII